MSEQKAWICFKCSKQFVPTSSSLKCPSCGSNATIPVEGKVTSEELGKRRLIEVQQEDNNHVEGIVSEPVQQEEKDQEELRASEQIQLEEDDQVEWKESEQVVGNQIAEYKVITDSDSTEFEKKINELGAKSWVLVSSYTKGPRNTVFVAIMEKKD
ncbi:hypothetical protein HN807_03080 [Candidatus Bathyarchaeota archaeon]|jgi:DNA-directed RNA polymerase subunit RPC12/RpoP|nr:hypothetical protein [Candidatus Bathyarchaeota archaeon]MBT4319513.1 hypothetical protein [Candidatus Bathyarchaeota archaeon]MBT4424996.1 hypothetical protein [Candidatus Bathyarchaeota archaeon]MBT7186668.1 hypothetical protein [Candidatus Bathyarchaeota archaeon]MBT7346051.1 hypothetical protein [Candidatus Bathyarchaeota archaeon]